ncbi:TetR/AcrR family transcriptional regulator [Streptomyces echinoruber]|uniref:TetR family transcriptional regulator n=2 Tax=Streptomyces echinoruber TaxID=68898 RepID=A0A918REZ9_9ACTN|nr:TetR family transcriptional regulator [Streptomyces echinoruber]GGZ94141.1 TetR family transcriptional regulator [Streptomyces echinoruber]
MTVMTSARTSAADRPRPGLRERKKIKTRQAIRSATYALIREQGYEATTIEQIAERAEVSPSTVFRYFPTKEDIVLTDEYDPLLLEELRRRPADEPWTESVRHVVRKAAGIGAEEDPEVTRLRARLSAEVPAVRSRMIESMSVTGRLLRQAIGERTGLDPDGLEVRVFAMSLVGGLMEVYLYWAEHGYEEDLQELIDRALDVIEHGLPAGKH